MNSNQAYMYNYYSFAKQFYIYLHIFTSTNMGVFGLKYAKFSTFFKTTGMVALRGLAM